MVLRLIEDLQRVRVFLEGENGFIQYRPIPNWQTSYEKYNDMRLIFNLNYWEGLYELFKYGGNLYMPKPIADCIRKIRTVNNRF